jgi:hypothetical protein
VVQIHGMRNAAADSFADSEPADHPDFTIEQALACLGYASLPAVLTEEECRQISGQVESLAAGRAGTRRLLEQPWCAALGARICTDLRLREVLPRDARVVQCTLFDKSLEHNWLVTLHQDLAIPVSARVDSPRLQAWSRKEGTLYVQPPACLLEQMLAVRVHLTDCGAGNGPLCVVPGSHRCGRLSPLAALRLREQRGERPLPVAAKDALLMRPLLLHSSAKALQSSPRRVLHFLLGPATLPEGLQWPHDGRAPS